MRNNAVLTKREFDKLEKRHTQQTFFSRYGFTNIHKGFRDGLCHYFLGTSGSGKTTVIRGSIIDCARTRSVLCHLSEEPTTDYKYKINKAVFYDEDDIGRLSTLRNINLISEIEDSYKGVDDDISFFRRFKEELNRVKPDIVFMDNLTTSILWRGTPREQEKSAKMLKQIASEYNIPFVIVVHTKKEISINHRDFIRPEDVRGNNIVAQLADYWYTLQNFIGDFGQAPIVMVQKSRYHDEALRKFFLLSYSKATSSVTKDKQISYEDLNEFFGSRYKLKENK